MEHPYQYCKSLTQYERYITREVNIGKVPLGGVHPIRTQSMTTTDTMDTLATVEQTIRIYEAGADYVRITAPSKREAENLANIKAELEKRGYDIPLIADIHFTPNAAEIAARIVEKVRVNPGNYADKKKFQLVEYSDEQYQAELDRIRKRFEPLVKICKEEGTAMRIGTNHGSLSDRIMSRYGDTPLGMVESALEFLRICEDNAYYDIVLSMKASNTQVMVQAYRLLINKMMEEGMNYPIHLGVTEAGDGEDGRIKSAVGIGTLLEDGIGDTVRVSLTEEPEAEIPVCLSLVDRYENRTADATEIKPIERIPKSPFEYSRRKSVAVDKIGGDNVPIVFADFSQGKNIEPQDLKAIGYGYDSGLDKWNISDQAVDFIYTSQQQLPFEIPGTLKTVVDASFWQTAENQAEMFPIFKVSEYLDTSIKSDRINFLLLELEQLTDALITAIQADPGCVLVLKSSRVHPMPEMRRFYFELMNRGLECPVIIKNEYSGLDNDVLALHSSIDAGGLLIDGLGDGIWLKADNDTKVLNSMSFGILQATRTRISKTEYISCPSCGRTLFDLQITTAMIQKRTNHLKGVKIGIMGCIVNGPGEMADADYGYVGSGVGKITLYRGQEVVKRSIPSEHAVDELIELIKEDGNWVEQPMVAMN